MVLRSCAYTHEHNGQVEHRYRHIVETGLALLAQASVPSRYWDYAFETTVYLINKMPTQTVYMKQPPWYEDKSTPDHLYLIVYVDDILVIGSDFSRVVGLLVQLASEFKIRDIGTPSLFLGIETVPWRDGLLLSQQRYMQDILKRAGMVDCKPLVTPVSLVASLVTSTTPYADPTQYRSLTGTLQYLTVTRPDLSFAVNRLCQHMHSPTTEHWSLLKRVLRYVKGTLHFGLHIRRSVSTELHAFSDSDWAGDPVDRKSTSSFAIFLGGNLVSWTCRKQKTMVRSSTEAEYKALADVSVEVTWLVSLMRELGVCLTVPPSLWCDNLGATYLCANPVFHARTKHVEIDYHFVRDKVVRKELLVKFISTKDQIADVFTKALPGLRFSFLRGELNVVSRLPCA
ncbi:PREDICTED: uncharacterized protein LOC109186229 [Ipomoea nil]|uniref:uncharacterized protein LOC109186229 n=1 Tax=Ipomoea nil TaxID=35883 RepID=UPI000900FE12|nr:PREDICTED: uncharacterized protein LOC109186229 [Ipomoea nil]